MITSSIEIDRPPQAVFDYVAAVERHTEWQDAILKVRKEPPGPTRLGTHNFETRRVPGGPREFETEIVEFEPPRRIVARGLTGPMRPTVTITIEPLDGGTRSRFTLALDLNGRGIGKLLAVLASRSARKQIPIDQGRLKGILESR